MDINLSTVLGAIKAIGGITLAVSPVKAVIEQAIALLADADDQETAKASLAQEMADNDAGHDRLQDKLADAAKR